MGDPTGRISHIHDMHRGFSFKPAVRVATTANITLSGTQTIDGVAVIALDRVLVKDQTAGSGNGIYLCAAGAWTRAPDMDQDVTTSVPAEEVMGAVVYVITGTVNGGTTWRNTNTTAPTLGTTALTFATFALTDPMTTRGDIIVRNASNVSARLAIGAAGKILSSDGTDPSWGNGPMTTAGDLIVGGTSGAPARLAKGADSQVLTVDPTTHLLVWAASASGFANPMTTKGDIIVGDTGGTAIRKAVGTDGQVLTADAASTGGTKWAASSVTITTVDQDISADFITGSGSTWTNITGMTGISVVAGTWIAMVDLEVYSATAAYGPVFRVWDGTTTYAQMGLLRNAPVAGVSSHVVFNSKPFVLSGTATMAVQYFSDTVITIKKVPTRGALTSPIATHITFLKIA